MPLPLTISSSVNPDWFYLPGFTFLVLAHPDSPGHRPGVIVVLVHLHGKSHLIKLKYVGLYHY